MQIYIYEATSQKGVAFLFYEEILILWKYTVPTYVITLFSSHKNLEIMKKILFFASLFFAVSCSSKNVIPSSVVIDTEKQILEEIKQQPEITSKTVEQIPFKKMGVIATFGTNATSPVTKYNYEIEYFANGKLKTVKTDGKTILNINYNSSQVTVNQNNTENKYELGSDNLVKNTTDGNDRFYYKSGYLSRNISNDPILKRTYTTTGNLLISETTPSTFIAVYDYYDYPNSIRQEILRPEAIHWSFRDDYLGKFSTNLLKKVTFVNNGTTLNFTYQFDGNNRVSKMIVDRKVDKNDVLSGTFEYTFSY